MSANASLGIDCRTAVTRSWIAATWRQYNVLFEGKVPFLYVLPETPGKWMETQETIPKCNSTRITQEPFCFPPRGMALQL
jgi:hypothetical protein